MRVRVYYYNVEMKLNLVYKRLFEVGFDENFEKSSNPFSLEKSDFFTDLRLKSSK